MREPNLGGFTRDDPFGSEGEPPPLPNSNDEWYYVEKGERKGPVSAVEIKHLLNSRRVSDDTLIWRSGMKDWNTVRESELYAFVDNVPPPISSSQIGNGYVWIMAFLPLLFAIIDASVTSYNHDEAARFLSLGVPPHPIDSDFGLKIFPAVSGLFAVLDFLRLKKAGYATWPKAVWAFVFPVVYLFLRAKALKQKPYYAITWIAMLVLGVLIDNN